MGRHLKRLPANFYCTPAGSEPVRSWLMELEPEDRQVIGCDIKDVEYGWPVGLPLCKPLTGYRNLWEVRSGISNGRIARVIFTVHGGYMVLLHGFVKKSQKTPQKDLTLAEQRRKEIER